MLHTFNFKGKRSEILELLSDGEFHDSHEIIEFVDDPDTMTMNNLAIHVHYLRKKLEKKGYLLLSEYNNRQYGYRICRRI